MRFPFNRRPAPAAHPDDWVTRLFARFMAEPEPASPASVIPEGSPQPAVVGVTAKAIGLRIREERRRLRVSQSDFAELGGQGPQSQGRYERGLRSPSAAYLAAISAAGVDVLYVVTGRREGSVK